MSTFHPISTTALVKISKAGCLVLLLSLPAAGAHAATAITPTMYGHNISYTLTTSASSIVAGQPVTLSLVSEHNALAGWNAQYYDFAYLDGHTAPVPSDTQNQWRALSSFSPAFGTSFTNRFIPSTLTLTQTIDPCNNYNGGFCEGVNGLRYSNVNNVAELPPTAVPSSWRVRSSYNYFECYSSTCSASALYRFEAEEPVVVYPTNTTTFAYGGGFTAIICPPEVTFCFPSYYYAYATETVTVDAAPANAAPTAPVISGPTTGIPSTNYTHGYVSTDPNGDTIRYGVDWNMDGTVDEWAPASGYTGSGSSQNTSHSWSTSGAKTFQALAQDATGNTSGWTSYTVTLSNPPSATLTNNGPIIANQSATLTWGSSNATSCTGTGFNTSGATSGSVLTDALDASANYSVNCSGAIANTTVTVNNPNNPVVYITASPERVHAGSATNVSWSATEVTSCSVTGTDAYASGALAGPTIATTTVSRTITRQTTYTITCNGTVSDSVIVNVVPRFNEF